jgi:PD-(D/E)XK nuclease superfamily
MITRMNPSAETRSMPLDPLLHFEFSQSSLQDFTDCRRRFQLRYLQRVAWPAIQAEPAREFERHIQRGDRFHRLAQQYLVGVPEERLARMAEADEDENLQRWWQNFLDSIPPLLSGARRVEVALQAPLDGFRLVAVYDLVLLRPDGRVVIYDWKTSLHRPSRAALLQRLQTRVYPYVLAQAGAALTGGKAIPPEQIEMTYWFAEPGQAPETLAYTAQRYQDDAHDLLALVSEIQSLAPQDFSMAPSEKPCAYCVYRSLCSRGVQAADMAEGAERGEEAGDDQPAPEDLNFDLEQIGEIGF